MGCFNHGPMCTPGPVMWVHTVDEKGATLKIPINFSGVLSWFLATTH